MTQFSTAVRNAMLDAIETTTGASPLLKIRTGAAPALPSDADSGAVLVSITLPVDWLAAASGGTAAKSGTWSGTCITAGTAGHYRIYDSTGVTCHQQGPISELSMSPSTTAAIGDTISASSWVFTGGNT